MPWSPVFRYCNHRVWVSSARLTSREYEVPGLFLSDGAQRAPPSRANGDCERRNRDDPAARLAPRTGERGHRDGDKRGCESAEEEPERAPLHARSLSGARAVRCRGLQSDFARA